MLLIFTRSTRTDMSHTHLPSSRCAACKCLRRGCAPNCILAPHFPSSNPQRFASVHKVFGAANVTKMLEQAPLHLRGQAAECIVFEAVTRMSDPVYGSVGIITQLHQQITQVQNEILKIYAEIALQKAHQRQCQHLKGQTMLHLQQLGGNSEAGPRFGRTINELSNLEDAGSASGQHYDLEGELDNNNNLFTSFNC